MKDVISSLATGFVLAVIAAVSLSGAALALAQDEPEERRTTSALASETPKETPAPTPEGLEEAPPPPPLPPLRSGPRDAEEDAGGDEDVPIPPKARGSDELTPVVRITTDDEGQIVEEYAVNGQVYMIKVTPKNAPAYYLFDLDGDGEMETQDIETEPGIKPVHWKLLEWD